MACCRRPPCQDQPATAYLVQDLDGDLRAGATLHVLGWFPAFVRRDGSGVPLAVPSVAVCALREDPDGRVVVLDDAYLAPFWGLTDAARAGTTRVPAEPGDAEDGPRVEVHDDDEPDDDLIELAIRGGGATGPRVPEPGVPGPGKKGGE